MEKSGLIYVRGSTNKTLIWVDFSDESATEENFAKFHDLALQNLMFYHQTHIGDLINLLTDLPLKNNLTRKNSDGQKSNDF